MDEVLEHIESWRAAGLIDEATAARLRAAEAVHEEAHTPGSTTSGGGGATTSPILGDLAGMVSVVGPAVTIGELFGYLGGVFLLGAWIALMSQVGNGSDLVNGLGAAIAALGVALVGLSLGRADARRSRAGGVCFLVSTLLAVAAGSQLAESAGLEAPVSWVAAGGAGIVVSALFRWHHPALLTQLAVLASLTIVAVGGLQWVSDAIGRPGGWDANGFFRRRTGLDPVLLVLGQASWWMLWAVGIGFAGSLEDRHGRDRGDRSASRRAALTRLWAGLVAVLGLASAIRMEDGANQYLMTRVVPAWVGDVALLLLSAVLVERAFRRDATAFLWAAALGVVIALTDLNMTYLGGDTWMALLSEGAILVMVGFLADRLRRALRGSHPHGDARRGLGPVSP
jgi:hypothetical protein